MTGVRTFRAMGCEIAVAGADERALAAIRRLFEEREATFSRFRPDSELRRVNASPQALVSVSAELARALRVALDAFRSSGGLVSPTVAAAVEAAGYDRDFSQLAPDDPRPVLPLPSVDPAQILVGERILRRPPGLVLDLNGVVKAIAVDDATRFLPGPGYVSAGGDLAARGTPVAVTLPDGDRVALESGAVATSGTATRSWPRAGALRHHLIDPRTGLPAASPWTTVTAIGRTCVAADVAAKAGFLHGHDGPEWLDEQGVAARFVSADGVVVQNGCWNRSLERRAA